MSEKPTYERLEQRVRELEKAGKALRPLLAERSSEIAQPFAMVLMICFLLSVCLFTGRVDAKDLSEEKLRQRNEELLSVLDAIPALVWIAKDPECHVITGNRYVNDLFRVANDANVSQTAAKMGQAVKIIHLKPDGTELQAEELPMQQSIARGEAVRNVEFSYLFPDGRQVFAIGNAVPLFDEDGRVRGSVGAFLDITKIKQASATIQKRTQVFLIVAIGFIVVMGVMLIVLARMWQTAKRSEEALRESEDRFRIAGKVAYDLIYEWDVASDALEWFGDIDGLMGYRKGEMSRDINAWLDLINPEDRVKLENAVELHKTSIEPIQYEYRVRYKDGTYRHWNDHGLPLLDDKGCPYKWVGVCTDITERIQSEEEKKELEAKLQRAEKMEAMGLMAGGVAHDLNNILSGIVSYPELLLVDLPEDSPLRNPIKTIQESGMRAADVVEDLLTIARGVTTSKEVLNLNTMIEQYMDSTDQQKLEKIKPLSTYRTKLDSELLNITCSASHVKKILMNLTVNASEAIEGTGTVTISTMNRYLDEPLKGYEDIRTGEYVLLSISDDGSGISPQDLDKIFEPFYTKKVMGRSGTGLGLAVVWNSMQDHKGYINVRTSEKGTVFELYFPTTREQVAAEAEEVPLDDYLGHGEKILVVDDEERQREIAGGILTRLGYTAETVSSGEEAIEYVKENPVDLIVLDMVMPKGINGRKTYEGIIKIRPGQKAIIASGYAKTKEVDMAQDLGAGKYIKKPYTLAKVGLAVKEELGK